MKKLFLALVSGIMLFAGSHAMAADLAVKAPRAPVVAAAPFSWTGFYIGGNLGVATLNDKQHQYDVGFGCWWTCADEALHNKMSGTGVIGGAQIGYNWQTSVWVFGIEADIAATSAKATFNGFCGSTYCDLTQTASLDALGTVRGRFGYAFDRAMLYATGGLAFAKVHNHVNDNNDPGLWDQNAWRAGWTAGAGLEYAVTSNWTVKAEALYYKLNDKTLIFTDSGTAVYPNTFKDDGALARLGVNYKFGGPIVAKY